MEQYLLAIVPRALGAQAWDSFCHRARECNKHPQVPWKAYLITLQGDEAKADFSLAQLRRLGLEVELVHGINSTQARLWARFAGVQAQRLGRHSMPGCQVCRLALYVAHVRQNGCLQALRGCVMERFASAPHPSVL